jgi:hypothetical protein
MRYESYNSRKYQKSIWTRWYDDQWRTALGTGGKVPKSTPLFKVENPEGDILVIEPTRSSSIWSWDTKSVTTHCPSCPLFVSRGKAIEISKHVKFTKRDKRRRMPDNIEGICAYGGRGSEQISKFLTDHPEGKEIPCKIGEQKIRERIEEKKKRGYLISRQEE